MDRRFCPACGQETGHTLQRPIREIIGEVLDETIALDSRFRKSLVPLLLRPGFLTVEHLAGRKARYTSPLKLYLLFSLVFFVAAALAPHPMLQAATPEDARQAREESRAVTNQGLAELRAQGRLGARVADRAQALMAMPRDEATARINAAFRENVPRVLFFLVPVLALFLKLFYWRRYYAEHLVTSLHAHAFAFAALLPSELLPWDGVGQVGAALTGLWTVVALRRIYGQGWGLTVVKGAVVLLAYWMVLAVGLAVALSVGLLLL